MEFIMKKTLRSVISIVLIVVILLCTAWSLFSYDRDFTRDMLLSCARACESNGNHTIAAWFYNLAYSQANNDESVAIELAQQYKASGNYTKAEYTLYNAISDGGGIDLYIALSQLYVEQDKLLDAVNMLNNVADSAIKKELDTLRPQTPTADTDYPPTHDDYYNQYITVTLNSEDPLYYTTNSEYPSTANPVYSEPLKMAGGKTEVQAVAINGKGLVSQLATFTYTVVDVVEVVKFNDPAIEASVRELINAKVGADVYTDDLWKITEFTVPAGAKSYADLPRFAFLEKLTIDTGVMDELVYINELTKLTELTIKNTNVPTDVLNKIAQFPLVKLTLSECNIYNISALSSITTLTHLDLSGNSISTITPLIGLTNLQELDLHKNNISDVSDLSGFTKLTTLNISQNALKTIAPLSALKALVSLDASTNQITALGNITQMTALSTLTLSENSLTNLVQLAAHPTLETLDVSGNLLTDISPLATLPALKNLDFSYNQVSEIPIFKQDCALVSITGIRNNLTDLTNLAGLKNLNIVNVEYNEQISSVDPLAECPTLLEVYIYGTSVTDVEKLKIHGISVNFNPTTQP